MLVYVFGLKPRSTGIGMTNDVCKVPGFGSPMPIGVLTRFGPNSPSEASPGFAVTKLVPLPKLPAVTATGFVPVAYVWTSKGAAIVASVGGVLVNTGGRFGTSA